jgi:hypothetical protein
MPKKKHRLSWKYEDLPAGHAAQTPEEDTLAVSPVEVAYPSDILAENAPIEKHPAIESEEAPKDAPAEDAPAEEYSTDEAAPPIEEYLSEEEAPPAEESRSAEEAPPIEEYLSEEEAPPAEESPSEEEAPPAEESPSDEEAPPAEEYRMVAEAPAAEEYPAPEEELAPHPPIEEAKADPEPEAAQHINVLSESEADHSDEEAAGNAEDLDDQAGELVLICTSCTTMLLIEHDGPCPYSVTSLMGSCPEFYSWFLHTTCFSCVNEQKGQWTSRAHFSDECMEAFRAAILSEAFMKRTGWFEVAGRVCRKPLRIVMDEGRRSVAYVKIDVVREQTTSNCRIRGLRPVGSGVEKGGRTEIIDSFVPGGFM